QNETRRTEAALKRSGLDEGLLHGIELPALLDRLHARAIGKRREVQATGNGSSIHQHGAAATKPLAAALTRAVEAKGVAQHFNQRLVRRDLRLDALAVERESNRAPHLRASAWN